MKDDKDISVTRAVGRFFGHIWGATTKPIADDDPKESTQVISHEVQEAASDIDGKKVVLRRTTIDEIEVREE